MPRFIQFLHNSVRIKKDPGLVVTNMHFGTIPVRLFKHKADSRSHRRGIIFFHGGTVLGNLEKKPHSQKDRQDEKAEGYVPDEETI